MANWSGSNRRSRLPKNWPSIRRRILLRDGNRCQFRDPQFGWCKEPATDVDHIRAGDDHSDSNLQALCGYHHGKKSAGEGAAAARKVRQEISSRFVRQDDHPGFL